MAKSYTLIYVANGSLPFLRQPKYSSCIALALGRVDGAFYIFTPRPDTVSE